MRYGEQQVGYGTTVRIRAGESDFTELPQHPDITSCTFWRDQDKTSFQRSSLQELLMSGYSSNAHDELEALHVPGAGQGTGSGGPHIDAPGVPSEAAVRDARQQAEDNLSASGSKSPTTVRSDDQPRGCRLQEEAEGTSRLLSQPYLPLSLWENPELIQLARRLENASNKTALAVASRDADRDDEIEKLTKK